MAALPSTSYPIIFSPAKVWFASPHALPHISIYFQLKLSTFEVCQWDNTSGSRGKRLKMIMSRATGARETPAERKTVL